MVQITPYEEQLNTPSGVTANPQQIANPIGGAISEMGAEAERVFHKVQSDWDHLAAQKADNARAHDANQILFTGDGTSPGFYALNGEDAVKAQPVYAARLAESRKRYEAGLTPGGRQLYQEQQGIRDVAWEQGMGSHVVKQSDVAMRAGWAETREQAGSDFALYFGHDAVQMNLALQKVHSTIIQETDHDGLGPEVTEARLRAADQDLYARAVKANIYPDPHKALEILRENKDKMNPVVYDDLFKEADTAAIHMEAGQLFLPGTYKPGTEPAPTTGPALAGGPKTKAAGYTEDSAKDTIGKAVPGATFTSGPRSRSDEDRLRAQGQPPVAGSYHSDYRPGGPAAWDVVPPKGQDLNTAAENIRKAMPGAKVIIEAGKAGHGPHIHVQWETGDAAAGPPTSGIPVVLGKDGEPDLEQMRTQARVAAGDDPNRQVAFLAQADARYQQELSIRAQKDQRAVDAVQPYLRNPEITSASQIPAGVWGALPEGTKTAVTEHYANGGIGGNGYARQDDPVALAGLYDMYGKNPDAFANLDLTQYVGKHPKLSQNTYQQMLAYQASVRQGRGAGKPVVQTYSVDQVMQIAQPMLVSAGVDPKTQDGQKRIALFQSKVIQGLESWKAQNPDKPIDANVIHQIADGLILSVHTDEGWLGRDRMAFEAPPGVGVHFKIPDKARAQIVDQYHQKFPGKGDPTEDQIVAAWRYLHNAGVYQ